jgi:hypothetical protein
VEVSGSREVSLPLFNVRRNPTSEILRLLEKNTATSTNIHIGRLIHALCELFSIG